MPEASPFTLNRDKGPAPLTLRMLTLCLLGRLPVTLPCLGPKTGPSVHPRHHVIPGTDFPLRRLTAPEPAWQPPLSAWAAAQALGHICGHDMPHPPLPSPPERELMPLGNLRLPNTPAWLRDCGPPAGVSVSACLTRRLLPVGRLCTCGGRPPCSWLCPCRVIALLPQPGQRRQAAAPSQGLRSARGGRSLLRCGMRPP